MQQRLRNPGRARGVSAELRINNLVLYRLLDNDEIIRAATICCVEEYLAYLETMRRSVRNHISIEDKLSYETWRFIREACQLPRGYRRGVSSISRYPSMQAGKPVSEPRTSGFLRCNTTRLAESNSPTVDATLKNNSNVISFIDI